MPRNPVQNHVRDDDNIIVEVEAEPNLEDDTEPPGPRCTLEWIGDHAEVICDSVEDMAVARVLLSKRPVKVKLKPVDDEAEGQPSTNLD